MRTIAYPFEAGGPVMWVLLAVCLAIWFLVVRRWLDLRCMEGSAQRLGEEIAALYRRSGPATCASRLASERGCVAEMLLRFFRGHRGSLSPHHLDAIAAEAAATLSGPREYLDALIGAAPLLGLLGTITGMVDVFSVLHAAGTSDPRLLSRGISEALITTEAGLAIAIPGLLADRWLRRKERRIEAGMEGARRVVARALRHGPEESIRGFPGLPGGHPACGAASVNGRPSGGSPGGIASFTGEETP
ncbi:MAG: MotA/TolQ/ExbB proton channel family protein [Planctomycetota bacterium]|nr:MotA/TolQ/ExbB proton channel family protein [Planctomycetota bacterium]